MSSVGCTVVRDEIDKFSISSTFSEVGITGVNSISSSGSDSLSSESD